MTSGFLYNYTPNSYKSLKLILDPEDSNTFVIGVLVFGSKEQ